MDKILFAMTGASTPAGKPSGYMSQGFCVPLAATGEVLAIIEEIGEDTVAEWFANDEVHGPDSGGLWVAEITISNECDGEQAYGIDSCEWRPPTTEEVEGLIARQLMRARGVKTPPAVPGSKSWTFIGALV